MQYDQFKGMLDRAIAVLATMLLGWMVKRGWLGESDAATLLPALVLIPALVWGAWVNRNMALIQSAGNVPAGPGKRTVVLTAPEIAEAMPEENVLPLTSSKEVINNAAKVAEKAQ